MAKTPNLLFSRDFISLSNVFEEGESPGRKKKILLAIRRKEKIVNWQSVSRWGLGGKLEPQTSQRHEEKDNDGWNSIPMLCARGARKKKAMLLFQFFLHRHFLCLKFVLHLFCTVDLQKFNFFRSKSISEMVDEKYDEHSLTGTLWCFSCHI